MTGDEEDLEIDACKPVRFAFFDEVIRHDGLDFPVHAELFVKGPLGDARHRVAVAGDAASVLSFDKIDKVYDDAVKIATFKEQVKNPRADEVLKKIKVEIDAWKKLNPSEYHTPEGMDALKQKIGGIVESLPFEEKTARLVSSKVRDSIKSEIVRQAPVYADVMKDYHQASNQIEEIERALSLGKKASIDTAMRKLQSLTRNNVNTNYGNRVNLAKQLEEQGGIDFAVLLLQFTLPLKASGKGTHFHNSCDGLFSFFCC